MPKYLTITHDEDGEVYHDVVIARDAEAANEIISALRPRDSVPDIYSIEDLRDMIAKLENATPADITEDLKAAFDPYVCCRCGQINRREDCADNECPECGAPVVPLTFPTE